MSLDIVSCLKGFIAVAEYKGFSQAALNSHVSTPTLTNQVQRLEQFLGKKLLHRTTRQVALTEAGELYLPYAKKILEDIQESKNIIHNLETEPHGLIRMGVPGTFNSPFFIKHMQAFLRKYSKIQLQILEENSPSDLAIGQADLVISETNVNDTQFIKEYLFFMRRGVYATPGYLKKHGTPKTIADLKQHNCLIAKRASPNDEWIVANNQKVFVSGNYAATSGFNIFYAGLAGMGLMWSTDVIVKDEVNRGKLIEVKLPGKPAEIKMYLYYRPAAQGSNSKLMAEYIKRITIADLATGLFLK